MISSLLHLAAMAALLAPLTAWAPVPVDKAAGRLFGTVTDATTGEALIGASVRVAGTSIGDATNFEGQFAIPNAPSGPQQLIVSYVGYQTDTLDVAVPDGGALEVDVALENATFGEVIVTAQVAGQLSAINEQFRDRTVVNVVSADRIQELPDNNAAESIGRLPGVAIQRSGGEATKVAIRGLSPKYNNVTVNGVRLAGTDGGDRSVDLSLVASNILDGIEVRKAITPDMDADAIGGTVNLRLRNAPRSPEFDLLAQGGYTGLQESFDNYKVVGTASNRFFSDRLGVIGTFNADSYDRSADKLGVGYRPQSNPETGIDELIVSSLDTREETVTRSRMGGSLLLDYVLPGGRLTANTFYNEISNDALYRNRQAFENNLTYNLEMQEGETSLWTSAIGAEQDFGWIEYDAAVTASFSRAYSPENLAFTFSRDRTAFVQGSPSRVGVRPQDVQVYTDSTILLSSLWADEIALGEDQAGLQLNLQAPFRVGTWVTGYVKTGGKLRWLDRAYDRDRYGRQGLQYPNANLFACLAEALPEYGEDFTDLDFRINDILLNYERGEDFLDGEFDLGLVPDDAELVRVIRALQSEACADPGDTPYTTEFIGQYHPDPISTLGGDYTGTERFQAGYVMAQLSIGDYVTVIPGIRYERDVSEYIGQRFRAAATGLVFEPPREFEPLTIERENTFWLPMVHLDIRPRDWLSLRLSRTETIARPGYNQYAPITSIDQYSSTVVAANSLLRPSQATNYDASVQIVQGEVGLVGVSAFYKEIDDLVLNVAYPINRDIAPPDGTNIPEAWYVGFSPTLYTSINSPAPTTFSGFELEWQTNFSYLPGALQGIVLNVNYTRSFSETTYFSYGVERTLIPGRPPRQVFSLRDTSRVGRMPDQAAHIANVTVGYDFRGFSTRLSYLFQSNTTAYVDTVNPLNDVFVGDYSRFDLSVRQRVRDGFEVFANFNNLNNVPDQRFQNQNSVAANYLFSDEDLTYRELYGFTADVGVRYRF